MAAALTFFPPLVPSWRGGFAASLTVGGRFYPTFFSAFFTHRPLAARAIAAWMEWASERAAGDYGLSPFTVIYSFIPHSLSSLSSLLLRRRRLLCSPIITWKSLNWGRTGERPAAPVDHRAIKDPHNSCHSGAHRIGAAHKFNTRPRLRESELV